MPHFGLMGERDLGPVAGPLLRARLHLRGGRRRLRQGKIAAGIVTLYDALDNAMQSYAADEGHRAGLTMKDPEGLIGERQLYQTLVTSRVLDGSFDFAAFDALTGRALNEELPGYDYDLVLRGVEAVMVQLGVMPFDEASLPPEDPSTF